MPMIRTFSTTAGHYCEMQERDFARLCERQPHPDDKEVFAVQVKKDGERLALAALAIAMPGEATVNRHRPGRNSYKGHFFAIGDDLAELATKGTGNAELDAFLAFIVEQHAAIAA
ncbi:MAG: hypothetical protein DI585_00345 [Pseudomonas fluorescens]|nr:MAG: hypothetical protein DI585_00345 [Pseudomonas fluorescens]